MDYQYIFVNDYDVLISFAKNTLPGNIIER